MTLRQDQQKKILPSGIVEFASGTMGGWAQVVVGHPFDTLKVRMQTQTVPTMYKNSLDCLKSTVKNEGVLGLFKGVGSPLIGIGFCNAVVFSANGFFLQQFKSFRNSNELGLADKAISGGLAGGVMAFTTCPVELVKVKLQTQYMVTNEAERYKGVFDCGVRIFKENGIKGLYRGLGVTIIREIPSYTAYFGCYEGLKNLFIQLRPEGPAKDKPSTAFEMFVAGGISGIAAWIFAYPQDIVKSRLQKDNKYSSTSACIRALREEGRTIGYKIYLNGLGPTLLRAFPANAATFIAYEWTKKQLNF
ncbi:Mitochondrial basic amino acids transporter [Zancudomyces culisetae]|uniref:Mitochondrial basic amino acids transporter n=1 Tax=Zancudomyces culisetae TaxID=1213189 RepID=A0A1R1PT98_ZANCU|nr:Mitochondrial basic amino acids transporter [Zancudomyces culisetae]|eukprot:OMH84190.1 Mitochondrial basic amino acids transporter [Zancudomyces culisetae]